MSSDTELKPLVTVTTPAVTVFPYAVQVSPASAADGAACTCSATVIAPWAGISPSGHDDASQSSCDGAASD